MKSFLEDLGKRLGETAEMVTNRAGEAVEIQRLRNQIRVLARGNAVDYLNLGKTVYEDFEAGEITDIEVVGICEAIQNRNESIEQCEQQIQEIRGDVNCEECGNSVAKEMKFCPYCGTKVPAEKQTEKEAFSEEEKVMDEDVAETINETVKETAATVEKAEENVKTSNEE